MEVTHVYPPNKEVAGTLRDGGTVAVSLFEVPSGFRWPIEGEIWTIERDRLDNTQWVLGNRVHHQLLDHELAITDMSPGEMRLDATSVVDRNGRQILNTESPLREFNTAGKTSAQIDALFSSVPPNGTFISDPTNKLLLIRQAGKWNKTAILTTIA
jgi:hypothetical protein